MRNSSLFACATALIVGTSASAVRAQSAQGFAVERFYPSAPGAAWLVMDDLTMHGPLGGAIAVTTGYARNPLRVATTDGAERLSVVSDQAFVDVGFAVTYQRFRAYLNFRSPLFILGQSGTVGGYAFTAPQVDVGRNPDTITDPRLGADVRIVGDAKSAFRLGAGAQLLFPNGDRDDYVTDATFRAMLRVLAAGDVGWLSYAGHVGVHIRPLDDTPTPGSPRGSELLFGAAAGPKLPVGAGRAIVVGPEIYGETAFSSFFARTATGLEALLSGRLEATGEDGPQLRVKLGAGGGIHAHFGAPEFRAVLAIEVSAHTAPPKKGAGALH